MNDFHIMDDHALCPEKHGLLCRGCLIILFSVSAIARLWELRLKSSGLGELILELPRE